MQQIFLKILEVFLKLSWFLLRSAHELFSNFFSVFFKGLSTSYLIWTVNFYAN